MKRFKFRQLNITVDRVSYGRYKVTGMYARKKVTRYSDNSKEFDKLDSDHQVEVREGQRYFYNLLKTY